MCIYMESDLKNFGPFGPVLWIVFLNFQDYSYLLVDKFSNYTYIVRLLILGP